MRKILFSALVAAAISLPPVAFAQSGGSGVAESVEMAFWNSVKDSRNPAELQAYLNKYPKGQFAELAAIRKQNLEMPKNSLSPTTGNVKIPSATLATAETKLSASGIDPKFDEYIAGVKSILGEKGRVDIRKVLPVVLPVDPQNRKAVTKMANQIFSLQFPNAVAISIGPTGKVAIGLSIAPLSYAPAESNALADCEKKRLGAETLLPKCEVFSKNRTINTKILIKLLEKARGPNFGEWMIGINESASSGKL